MTPRQKLILNGIYNALSNIQKLKSDGAIRLENGVKDNYVSLFDAENHVIGSHQESKESLHQKYEQHKLSRTDLVIDQYRWVVRIDPAQLEMNYGISDARNLNQRQLWVINAAIFEVTNPMALEGMKPGVDANYQVNLRNDIREALKGIDFTKIGMEFPLDDKLHPVFAVSVHIKLLESLIHDTTAKQNSFMNRLFGTVDPAIEKTVTSLTKELEIKKQELLLNTQEFTRRKP